MVSYNKLTLVILTISYPLIALSGGQGYKTQCSKDGECDRRKFLECNLHSYACDCPKSTVWNSNKQQCLTMEGRPCDLHHSKGPECVSNSTCTSGRCTCDDGYLKNNFGICQLGHNMPCDESEGQFCSWRYMLECPKSPDAEKRCKCRGENLDYTWDQERAKCVSLVGTGCDLSEGHSDDKIECVKGGYCVKDICECLQGYSMTPQGTCLLKYGEICDNKAGDFCNKYSFLNCRDDGKCGCEFYGQMDFDFEAQECHMLVGEFCDLPSESSNENDGSEANNIAPVGDGRTHRCVRDAECVPGNHHNGKGICTCTEGKLKTPEGTCTNARGYGLPCSFVGDCNTSAYLTCVIDEQQGGHCDCIPNDMFSDGTECLVFPGRSCTINSKCGRNSNCENGQYCICNEGYILDPKEFNCHLPSKPSQKMTEDEELINQNEISPRTNDGEKEEGWISWNDCSKMPSDSLMFQRCDCSLRSQSHIWSDDKQKCLGLVGSYCEYNDSCTEYADCDAYDKTCQCELLAKTTADKTCVLKRSNIGHQPYQGHNNGGIHDRTEWSRLNPMVMKATSGVRGWSLGLGYMFSIWSIGLILI